MAPSFGPWISCLEWATFSCTHTLGSGWKFDFGTAPSWVLRVMANGFYSAVGVWSIAGLHCLPLLIYLQSHMDAVDDVLRLLPAGVSSSRDLQKDAKVGPVLRCCSVDTVAWKHTKGWGTPQVALDYGWWILAAGRAIVMAVELWFVLQHVTWMCEGEDEKKVPTKHKRGKARSGSSSPARTKNA